MVKRYTLNVYGKQPWNPGDDGECEYHFAEKIPEGRYSIILESDADALAERCERLEAALRGVVHDCQLGADKYGMSEHGVQDIIRRLESVLSGSSGGKDG